MADDKKQRKQILIRITEEEEAVWEEIRAQMGEGKDIPLSLLARRIMAAVADRADLMARIETEDYKNKVQRAAHARQHARPSAA
jgi:hypothetical protein